MHDHDDLTFNVSSCPNEGKSMETRGWYAGVGREDGDILQSAMMSPEPFQEFCRLHHERYGVRFETL